MLFNEIKLPVQKRSKARLALVIETTVHILESEGIAQCTIPQIALRSNLPKINIYQYFPTVNHLFSIMVKDYLDELQNYVSFKSEHFSTWTAQAICMELIEKVCIFYNEKKAASILILGGPVHVDGFNLQELVIEKISADIQYILNHKQNPLYFKNPNEMTYLVEMVFALMKHSFYKYGKITYEIQEECIAVSDLYLAFKGHSFLT